jgi:hypothetical protein
MIMLSLGINGSCEFLHYASGRCGGTNVGLCLGHTLAVEYVIAKNSCDKPSTTQHVVRNYLDVNKMRDYSIFLLDIK